MSRTMKWILAANLAVIAVLAFVYPHLMVGPGKLIPGHRDLEADCFACHTPFTGTDSRRCITCHQPADIGRLTTKGLPVSKPLTKTAFHQELASQDCVACHSDHAGVRRFRQEGRFNHALLKSAQREDCKSCHKAPDTRLHRDMTGQCSQCHKTDKWTPATFDHDKYFALDRDHNTRCITCHVGNDYSRYTCYGCHEHTPSNIRAEHVEEGIRNFNDCVECHRSANEHDIRFGGGEGRGGEGRGGEGSEGHRRGGRERDDD